MSRRKKPAEKTNGAVPATNGGLPKRRVTFVIDEALDNLLEVYCNASHLQKNVVAESAIAELLVRRRKEVQEAVKKTEAAISQLPSLTRSQHA